MTKTGDAARPEMDLDGESFLEMLGERSREITIGVIVLAAVAALAFIVRDKRRENEDKADAALALASGSFFAGNSALAATDLQQIVNKSADTPAGVESAIMLAETMFESRKYDDGVKVLQKAASSGAVGPFAASIEALMGAAAADQKKTDESAKHYLAAAEKARFPNDQDLYKAEAARIYAMGGKKSDAIQLWTELANRPDSPTLAEAKIRLGELEGGPAK
jgi:tetratricopeptide (TPR) repeat protein